MATSGSSAPMFEASSTSAVILDVLVEFDEIPTLPRFISLERKLREITGIKVDLVSIRALKGEIGERIQIQKIPV